MKSKKASTGVGASALSNSGGMFHTGVLNSCPANDMSFFCQMSRWFSILMIIIAVLVIIYLAYVFIGPYFMKKRR